MNVNRILFRYILGTIAEAVLIVAAIYDTMRLAVWISDKLTAATIIIIFAVMFAAAIAWMWWDSKTSMEVKRNEEI